MTTANRVDAIGYNWIALAESIAHGQIDEQAIVDACLASEGHCINIVSVNLKEMGSAKTVNIGHRFLEALSKLL